MPGGFFMAAIFLFFAKNYQIHIAGDLDFLYTFLFFCSAFIVGELLQTVAHALEWVVDIFFKRRRPSHIFLYKENPILKSDYQRSKIIHILDFPNNQLEIFDKEYSDLSFFRKQKKDDKLSQDIFWKLYSSVSNQEEMRVVNRNYLFSRVIMVEFLFLTIFAFLSNSWVLVIVNLSIFLLFWWRTRGIARGLVFKTVLLNLKSNK